MDPNGFYGLVLPAEIEYSDLSDTNDPDCKFFFSSHGVHTYDIHFHNLHFAGISTLLPQVDPIGKICSLIDCANERLATVPLEEHVSLDEQMEHQVSNSIALKNQRSGVQGPLWRKWFLVLAGSVRRERKPCTSQCGGA